MPARIVTDPLSEFTVGKKVQGLFDVGSNQQQFNGKIVSRRALAGGKVQIGVLYEDGGKEQHILPDHLDALRLHANRAVSPAGRQTASPAAQRSASPTAKSRPARADSPARKPADRNPADLVVVAGRTMATNGATAQSCAHLKQSDANRSRSAPRQTPVQVWMVVNLLSSIALVLINKKLTMAPHNFNYVLTLTVIHFAFTYVGLLLNVAMGLVQMKKLSWMDVVPISAAFSGFVALTNVSLRYNSVGVYQIFKILTSPTIVCIEFFFYSKVIEPKLLFALLLVCVGAGYTSVSDVEFNFKGTAIAAIATVVTSCYQIWTNTCQKQLGCSSMQLLLYQVPLSSLMILALIPSQEETGLTLEGYTQSDAKGHILQEGALQEWSVVFVGLIALTGVLAFLVNLSTFMVIGSTSAITYNVLGHLKSCVIISSNFILFSGKADIHNLSGIALTLVGIFTYSYFKLQAQRPKK